LRHRHLSSIQILYCLNIVRVAPPPWPKAAKNIMNKFMMLKACEEADLLPG